MSLFAVLKHSLNDAASKLVDAHVVDFALECLDNKLNLFAWYLLYNLLNDVIPVCIFNTGDNVRPDFLNYLVL